MKRHFAAYKPDTSPKQVHPLPGEEIKTERTPASAAMCGCLSNGKETSLSSIGRKNENYE